jgi:hypothetical protein
MKGAIVIKKNIIQLMIRVYRNKYIGCPEWDIIPAWEIKKGNNVLYVHKKWDENLVQENNPEYIKKSKKKRIVYSYTITHKSGIAFVENIKSNNTDTVIKLAERLLKKHFFGFFFHYPYSKRIMSMNNWDYINGSYRRDKVDKSNDIIYKQMKIMKLI